MRKHGLFSLSGFEFHEERHAGAILTSDYSEVCQDLLEVLDGLLIPHGQILAGGGGKSSITKALEKELKTRGWLKETFNMQQTINEQVLDSTTHEIDHFKKFHDGRRGIALEIEWNNKDPFYDRDLSNFSRLHLIGAISAGIIITRGPSLQKALRSVFMAHYKSLEPSELQKAIATVREPHLSRIRKAATSGERADLVASVKASSKYGQATTHWTKLLARIDRGLGNPCPLLLVGIEETRLQADR